MTGNQDKYRELKLFVALAVTGVVAALNHVHIPHTDALIDGRWAFGFMGFVLLGRWWAALALAALLSYPYGSPGIPLWVGFWGNMLYAVPCLLVIRPLSGWMMRRLGTGWWFGLGWLALVLACYQAFTTPMVWAVLALMEGQPVGARIVAGWLTQPFLVESVLVALSSAGAVVAAVSLERLKAGNRQLRATERELRESEELIRAVMDNLPVGIAVNSVDPAVEFSYMNENFPIFYHTTREALAVRDGFWVAVYEDAEFREEIRRRVLDDCASGDPERTHWDDVPITRKGEETTFVSARNTPVPGKNLTISTVWDVTERKRAEARTEHLNRVLRAIRDVNQLITHETDRAALLRRSCEILTSTRGYRSAWVALRDADGRLEDVAESGIGEDFSAVRAALERREWPECHRRALEHPDGIAVIHDTGANCKACALKHTYRDTAALAGRLRYGERDYGALVVALPRVLAVDEEEQSLFRELIGDVAYALHAIDLAQARKQAEEDLAESERFLANVIEQNPSSTWISDGKGTMLRMNRACRELFGVTEAEVVGKFNILADNLVEAQGHMPLVRDVFEKGTVARFTIDYDARDVKHIDVKVGKRRILDVVVSPIRDAQGHVTHAIVQHKDVTEFRQAEADTRKAQQAIAEGEARFRAAFEGTTDSILIWDRDYNYLYANDAAIRHVGAARDQVIGKNMRDGLGHMPEFMRLWMSRVDNVFETGATLHVQDETAMEGKRVYTDSIVSPVLDQEHNVTAVCVTYRDITELKQAEEALAESEKKYRSLFETMSEGIVYEDHDGKIVSANPAAERLLGLSLDQMRGRTSTDPRWKAIHEDGSPFPGENHSLNVAAKTGKPATGEIMGIYNPQSDHVVWLSVNSIPEFLPGETTPFRAYAVFRDITERKRAEEALRESIRLNSSIMHAAQDIIVFKDDNFIFRLANPVMCNLIGKAESEIIGKTDFDLFPYELAARYRNDDKSIIENGRPFSCEEEVLSHEGIRYVNTIKAPVLDENNACQGIVVITRDITERKQAEEELRKHRDHLEELVQERTAEIKDLNLFNSTILDTSPVGILSYRADGQCVSANESAGTLVGATRAQVLAQNFRAIASWRGSGLLASADRCLETGEPQRALVSIRTTFGKDVVLDTRLARFMAHDEPHLLLTFSDITERVRAEESLKTYSNQLKASNMELEAFAHSVSHDLRAPLRGIYGWSQALEEDYGERLDEQGREFLRDLRGEAQRMGVLIDDLLALSRVARVDMRREDVDLSALARSIAAELQRLAPARRVEFLVAPGLQGLGDPVLLRQMLENLLGNAWKFTGKRADARIEVGRARNAECGTRNAELADDAMVYFVRDNGAGFNMAHATNLFAPFQRLHRVSEFPGTGIGLATVQRILHRHGGHAWAEAETDQGATFYFTLPEGRGTTETGVPPVPLPPKEE